MAKIIGDANNNNLIGTTMDDYLFGYAGNDTLTGSGGNDYLDGGLGIDTMIGGAGNDTYYIEENSPTFADVVIELQNEGIDTAECLVSYTLADNVENLILAYGGVNETATGIGNSLNNTMRGSALGITSLSGLAGNDSLNGSYLFSNTLDGGDGNDYLYGGKSNDILKGGAGNDFLRGYKVYYADNSNDTLDGGLGDDELYSVGGNDLLKGGGGNDKLWGGAGNDTLNGDAGNDSLNGDAGDDTLNGGAGDDTLNGGVGISTLTGGAGIDTFQLRSLLGIETITDFEMDNLTTPDYDAETIVLGRGDLHSITSSGLLPTALFQKISTVVNHNLVQSTDTNNYVIYDTDTGKLYYDADANGIQSSPVQIALIGNHPDLIAVNFEIV